MSSLLFWLFLHWISVTGGRHLFWLSLFVLAVTICSGRHYLFWPSLCVIGEIERRISQNNNDDICPPLCLLILICLLQNSAESCSSWYIISYQCTDKFLWQETRSILIGKLFYYLYFLCKTLYEIAHRTTTSLFKKETKLSLDTYIYISGEMICRLFMLANGVHVCTLVQYLSEKDRQLLRYFIGFDGIQI